MSAVPRISRPSQKSIAAPARLADEPRRGRRAGPATPVEVLAFMRKLHRKKSRWRTTTCVTVSQRRCWMPGPFVGPGKDRREPIHQDSEASSVPNIIADGFTLAAAPALQFSRRLANSGRRFAEILHALRMYCATHASISLGSRHSMPLRSNIVWRKRGTVERSLGLDPRIDGLSGRHHLGVEPKRLSGIGLDRVLGEPQPGFRQGGADPFDRPGAHVLPSRAREQRP